MLQLILENKLPLYLQGTLPVQNRESFEALDFWLDLVKKENGDTGYTLGVAGNKSDLYQDSKVPDIFCPFNILSSFLT